MLTPEQKHQNRVERIVAKLKCLSIGSVFNKHPGGLACLFQKLVRLKAADNHGCARCVTCGKVQSIKEMNASHFISRKNKTTILDPMNVHVACVNCNKHKGGNLVAYREYLVGRYGEQAVQDLEARGRSTWQNPGWHALAEVKIRLLDEIKELECK